MTRHKNSIPLFNVKHDCCKNSFFPSTIIEWKNLDPNTRNSESAFRETHVLAFMRPSANSTFDCHRPKSLKLTTRLRIGLSHL